MSILVAKSDWRQFENWYAAKSWVQTTAELADLRLNQETKTEKNSDGQAYQQTYFSLIVAYQYEVNAQKYNNSRASFAQTSETYRAGYNGRMFAKLDKLRSEQQAIMIWYDPADPNNSVIDRSLRADTFGSTFVLIFMFGGIGLVGLYYSIKSLMGIGVSAENSAAAFGYSILVLLVGFCLMSANFAISAIRTGDLRGLVALVFPGLIVPFIIMFFQYSKDKKNKNSESEIQTTDQKNGIKGRPSSFSTYLYLGILVLLITLPLAWNEYRLLTDYTAVSYFIFSLPVVGLWLIFHHLTQALAIARLGDLILVMESPVPINRSVNGRIEGEGLSESLKNDLSILGFVTHRVPGRSSMSRMLDETVKTNFSERDKLKCFKFDLLLSPDFPETQETENLKIELVMRLTISAAFGATVTYLFEGISAVEI